MYKISTLDAVLAQIDPSKPLALDTETIGLYGKIRLAQFYQQHWDKVLIVDKPDPLQLFIALTTQIKDVTLVLQHGNYDVSVIQKNTGSRYIPANFEDTFYLARLAYPALDSFSLDQLMEVVLGFDPYKKHGISKSALQKSDWKVAVLRDDQLAYAAIDVYYLLDVYEHVKNFRDDISYKLDIHATRKALDFQNNGMPIVRSIIEDQYSQNVQAVKALDVPINVNSWQQVRPYVNGDSDALALATMALQGNTRAERVLKAKRFLKQNSFMDKWLEAEDDRIYGHFAPSARSGRFTCSSDNLQQLPRKLKHCFGFEPDDGRVLLYADYPQLELRTIAAIVKEQKLIELFKQGGDPHGYVAQQLFGPNWTKDHRQVVKTYNFNLLYVGGATMVQSILIRDFNTWRDLDLIARERRAWLRAWPAINNWQQEVVRSHRRKTLRSTPFGRRYLGKRVTDHANIENQGFGAEVAKLALHYMYDDLVANEAKLCNFIHDSYIVEMPKDETVNRKVALIMKEAMIEAWTEACKMVAVKDIPMPAEVACGYNWGNIEQDDFLFKV